MPNGASQAVVSQAFGGGGIANRDSQQTVKKKQMRGLESKKSRARRLQKARERAGVKHVRQAEQIRAFLKSREADKRWVIEPNESKYLGYWDSVSGVALLYTALMTPFEVAFLSPSSGLAALSDPFYYVNRTLDCIFLCDLILQFFVAYQSAADGGGFIWITDRTMIVRHYLCSWFPLDSMTIVLPLTFDMITVFGDGSEGGIFSDLSILRVLRVLRLFKLFRLVRASRIMRRWLSRISLSHATLTMMQCGFMLLLSAHWYACVIALQASLHSDPQSTWLGEDYYNFCKPLGNNSVAGPLLGCEGLDLGAYYLGAFSWSIMVITGTGGTDFYPSAQSTSETALVTLMVIIGAILWTQVLAMFCDGARGIGEKILDERDKRSAQTRPHLLCVLSSYVHPQTDNGMFLSLTHAHISHTHTRALPFALASPPRPVPACPRPQSPPIRIQGSRSSGRRSTT